MNEKLKELYYKDDVIIGSKQNFINIAKKTLNASTRWLRTRFIQETSLQRIQGNFKRL